MIILLGRPRPMLPISRPSAMGVATSVAGSIKIWAPTIAPIIVLIVVHMRMVVEVRCLSLV